MTSRLRVVQCGALRIGILASASWQRAVRSSGACLIHPLNQQSTFESLISFNSLRGSRQAFRFYFTYGWRTTQGKGLVQPHTARYGRGRTRVSYLVLWSQTVGCHGGRWAHLLSFAGEGSSGISTSSASMYFQEVAALMDLKRLLWVRIQSLPAKLLAGKLLTSFIHSFIHSINIYWEPTVCQA